VTFEDGRKGVIEADIEIRDVKTFGLAERKEAPNDRRPAKHSRQRRNRCSPSRTSRCRSAA
jgi:hypothetical protein